MLEAEEIEEVVVNAGDAVQVDFAVSFLVFLGLGR